MPQLTYENAKPCGYPPCGIILYRRPRETDKKWRRRKACGQSHGMLMRRPVLPASKVCKRDGCGRTYDRPKDCSHARWARQEFCSKRCSVMRVAGANRILDEKLERKVCELDGCDVVYVRNPKLCTPARWKRRRFCSTEHVHEHARREGAKIQEAKPPKPARDPKPAAATPRTRTRRAPRPKPAVVDTPPPPRPVFPGPPPTEVWRPAAWAGRDIRPRSEEKAS